jgi:hypothetical protein
VLKRDILLVTDGHPAYVSLIPCVRIISVNKFTKSLFTFLLLVALPFQAFAAATMMISLLVPGPVTGPSSFTQGPLHIHAEIFAVEASATEHGAQNATVKQLHAASSPHMHDCSSDDPDACSACCHGTQLASSLSSELSITAPGFEAIPFDACRVPTIDLAPLERPPQFA